MAEREHSPTSTGSQNSKGLLRQFWPEKDGGGSPRPSTERAPRASTDSATADWSDQRGSVGSAAGSDRLSYGLPPSISERPSAGVANMSERPSAGMPSERHSAGSAGAGSTTASLRSQLAQILTEVRSQPDGFQQELVKLNKMNPREEPQSLNSTWRGLDYRDAVDRSMEPGRNSPTASEASFVSQQPGGATARNALLGAPPLKSGAQGLDAIATAVRALECRVQEILTDISNQAARISSLERGDSVARKAQGAAVKALQDQQEELRIMVQSVQSGGPAAPPVAGNLAALDPKLLEEPCRIVKELRNERSLVADMLENVKQQKLDVITVMHGFQVNKDLAIRELKDLHHAAMEAASVMLPHKSPAMAVSSPDMSSSRLASASFNASSPRQQVVVQVKGAQGSQGGSRSGAGYGGGRTPPASSRSGAGDAGPGIPEDEEMTADQLAAWQAMAGVSTKQKAQHAQTGASRFEGRLDRRRAEAPGAGNGAQQAGQTIRTSGVPH